MSETEHAFCLTASILLQLASTFLSGFYGFLICMYINIEIHPTKNPDMKTIVYTIFLFLAGVSNAQQSPDNQIKIILQTEYHGSIISKGDNLPDFDRKKDNIDKFLVALHYGINAGDFMRNAGWTEQMLDEKVNLLIRKGWLLQEGQQLKPTVFIVTKNEGAMLYEYARPLADAIASSIEEMTPGIREKYRTRKFDPDPGFDRLSFLILSDVLLDNWQIMHMESIFLKQENRPERHGKFYYAGIMENPEEEYEPFRIYGNQSGRINDSTWLNIYGNNRISANGRLKNDKAFRDSVLADAYKLTPEIYAFFEEISEEYRPELIKILEDNREYSMGVFRKTRYSEQIRFEEFFIWWYHFIYTSATDILSSRCILTIPAGGNFYYHY